MWCSDFFVCVKNCICFEGKEYEKHLGRSEFFFFFFFFTDKTSNDVAITRQARLLLFHVEQQFKQHGCLLPQKIQIYSGISLAGKYPCLLPVSSFQAAKDLLCVSTFPAQMAKPSKQQKKKKETKPDIISISIQAFIFTSRPG